MAKKNNNNIFDLVFNEENPNVSVERNNAVFEAVTEKINLSLEVRHDDITVSSLEERYLGRVNIKVFNL